ncbi:hypothetical protein DPMN_006984 [Dreissena polymorpha]|uniref:Uncharacterized protein n=1 Tax=Dreissena polymorpha TaxID=45954 RepID=A0A9D4RVI6_DREPO|nr:hypothetical protein DPMN_031411 [Dreissena polymorpha]KAH3883036.1 hypothetical protein DPMN_006984 [Dreissena polymorpha]
MSSNGKFEQTKLNFKGKKPETKPANKKQRADSSNSTNTSMDDLSNINTLLENMTEGLAELREDFKSMLKREEIEDLIKKTVSTIMNKIEVTMIKTIETEVTNRTNTLNEKLTGLEFENEQLKQKVSDLEKNITKSITEQQIQIEKHYETSREALKLANYNEQYSRKNNVKIMNIKETSDESETKLIQTVSNILKTTADVDLKHEDIMAIHRIPSKMGTTRPILIKLKNNNAKSAIMKKRTPMKSKGYKLVDDVTKRNQGLISRLFLHPDIKNAWFFNGAVFGQTASEQRIKFDIFDNINDTISDFRNRSRKL